MYGTYCRLRVPVWASDMDVIRAARGKIAKHHRRGRATRGARHQFYRTMLDYHARASQTYDQAMGGI
jgi:hypothetical protein